MEDRPRGRQREEHARVVCGVSSCSAAAFDEAHGSLCGVKARDEAVVRW